MTVMLVFMVYLQGLGSTADREEDMRFYQGKQRPVNIVARTWIHGVLICVIKNDLCVHRWVPQEPRLPPRVLLM
jgi:hypothetical protein